MLTRLSGNNFLVALAFSFIMFSFSSGAVMGDQYQNSYNQNSYKQTSTAVLYYHPSCGHCKKVMAYLNQINKTLPMKNTSNPRYRQELKALGQNGVPALAVDSRVIVGADPIISYLKSHPEVLK